MINVGIVSSKENVAFNMASVVCKVGAHCERMDKYSFTKIKTFNIVVIDLDNLTKGEDDIIKQTAAGFNDIIVAGFSRSQDVMDEFRPIMNVQIKPFKKDHILSFIEDLKHLEKDACSVNREENPIYTPNGNATFNRDALNTDVFSDEELSLKLSKVINKHYDGLGEKQFLKSIELDNAKIPEEQAPIIVELKQPKEVDFTEEFINDALLMYRAKKLKQLRLSPNEIKNRVKALMLYDAQHGRNQKQLNTEQLETKFESSSKINVAIDDNVKHAEIKEVEFKIEDQRSERIEDEIDYIDMPDINHNEQNNDNYNQAELKYIKQSATPDKNQNVKPVPKSTSMVPAGDKKIVMDKAELSKKVQSSMTPEQIEKLRKLGVKI